MKANERFRASVRGQRIDRLPVIEWATWWNLTIDRWKAENPSLEGLDIQQLHRHFGLDINLQKWFTLLSPVSPRATRHGAPIVHNMKEYLQVKPTLYPMPNLSKEWFSVAQGLHNEGDGIVWFTFDGFFWGPRVLLGIEEHLYSFYDEPELYKAICEDLLEWQKKVVKYLKYNFDFDFMTFGEDMSYNNGPMISKDLFDEFLAPYYKEIVPIIKKNDIITIVDSDGDITKAVDWFSEVGVEGMLPLERQAGVDVGLYINMHPDMCFIGHFDKMVMHLGEDAIKAEFERLLPSMKKGRFIPSVDHQTPPRVSYQDYCLYVRYLKEYAKKAVL